MQKSQAHSDFWLMVNSVEWIATLLQPCKQPVNIGLYCSWRITNELAVICYDFRTTSYPSWCFQWGTAPSRDSGLLSQSSPDTRRVPVHSRILPHPCHHPSVSQRGATSPWGGGGSQLLLFNKHKVFQMKKGERMTKLDPQITPNLQ